MIEPVKGVHEITATHMEYRKIVVQIPILPGFRAFGQE
jgi:hypothetical protein